MNLTRYTAPPVVSLPRLLRNRRHYRRFALLLILALFCTSAPPAIHAQEAAPLYCAALTADDCALLTAAHEQMRTLHSVTAKSHVDFAASNIPDAPFESLTLTLDQQTAQSLSTEALAALLELRQIAQTEPQLLMAEPQRLLDFYAAFLTGANVDSTLQLRVSEDVVRLIEQAAAEEGEPIPFPLPNQVEFGTRLIDGTLYVNLSNVAALLPGLTATGDIWFGVELAPVFDLAFKAALADADFNDMGDAEAELFAQILGASASSAGGPLVTTLAALPFGAQVLPFLNIERVQNGQVNGGATARFRTTVNYAALLADPTVQELIAQLIRDPDFGGQEMDEMKMARTLVLIQQFGPTVLETLGLELVEQIDLATGLFVQGELTVDWDVAQLAPLLAVAGLSSQNETQQLPIIKLNSTSTYGDQNADLVIEPPAAALIISTSELLDLIPPAELGLLNRKPAPTEPVVPGDDPFAAAVALSDAGDPLSALPLFDQVLALEPDNAEYYTERGRAHYLLGHYAEALADAESALALEPNARRYNLHGAAHKELGHIDEAFADYALAIEADPSFQFAYFNRGLLYANQGEYTPAIADFDAAIAIDSAYADAYNERGLAYYWLGEYATAIENYDTAIELRPNNVRFYTNRGDAYGQAGEYSMALADYDAAISLDPAYAPAYNNRGYTYYLQEAYDDAVTDYNMALELEPNYLLAYGNRGDAYAALGDYEAAIADYDATLELNPQYGWVYARRADAYNELGNYAQALADYNAAIAFDDQDADTYFQRALVHYNLDELEPEIADYTATLELDPTHTTAYYFRALSYLDLGEPELALEDFGSAIALEPDNANFYIDRGYAHSLLGNHAQALADADVGVELAPDNPVAWGNRADANGKLGNYDQAFSDFDRALELDPEHAVAYLDRGKLYHELGQTAQAIADLERYLELAPDAEDREEVETLLEELYAAVNDAHTPKPAAAVAKLTQIQPNNQDAETSVHPLLRLLQMVPDTPEYRKYLAFGDAAAWHTATGTPRVQEVDELNGVPKAERDALLFTMPRETLPPAAFGAQYMASEDQRGHFGFNLFTLERWLEAGNVPGTLTIAEVDTDSTARIADALTASGYSSTPLAAGSTLYSIRDDFEIQIDAPLRTGMMGELNRIILDNGQMIIGRATEVVESAQTAATGGQSTLADVSAFHAAAQALTDDTLADMGALVGVLIVEDVASDPAAMLGLNPTAEEIETVRKYLGEASLLPVLLPAFGTHRNGDATYLTLAAVFAPGADAAEVTAILAERMRTYTSLVTKQPLAERWTFVQATPLEIDGLPVALVTMQVNDPAAPLAWSQMVFARDLAFLWSD
ncbi:MAG: tetratricopeptide repeat protein [Caldilineaceae bacterium]|nr:tetratricopeptide repeat protein [Caldilineaceae bacterium]